MTITRVLAALAATLSLQTVAVAQEITPNELCEAGMGELLGGIGRLGCTVITDDELTADDLVGALPGSEPPLAVSPPILAPETVDPRVFNAYPDALEFLPNGRMALQLSGDPCTENVASLDCKYEQLKADLEAKYDVSLGEDE